MLPHATEIAALSEHALEAVAPGFARRAQSLRGGLLVAGSGVGGGERGEIAALVLAALGVRGVLARRFDTEFHRHLVHAGILPLLLAHEADVGAIEPGDELEIPGLPEALAPGKPLVVRNLTRGSQYTPQHDLAPRDIAILEAGGLLAFHRETVEVKAPA
jgi:aconitate hydratase